MDARRKRLLTWCVVGGVLLLIANPLVAIWHLGRRAGQTYCWVCPETGAELSYSPSVFGSARLKPDRNARVGGCSWELVEPQPRSLLLPWNWLARALDRSTPDP